MTTKSTKNRRRYDTEHHLRSAVIGLTAVLFAVSIYTYHYVGASRNDANNAERQPSTLNRLTDLSDTPMDSRVLSGTIKEFSDTRRMVVRSTIVRNGQASQRSYLVTVNGSTKIITVDQSSTMRPGETVAFLDPIRRTADRNAILAGRTVNITTLQSIDGREPLTAQTVEIVL